MFNSNSSNTVVKCCFISNMRHMTNSIGLDSFLLTRLGTKPRARSRLTNSLELDLEIEIDHRTRTGLDLDKQTACK